MTRQPIQSAIENRFAAESRSFVAERYAIGDGYGDGYNIFDGYAVIVTTDGVEADPVLVPMYQLAAYDAAVAKMERDMGALSLLPEEEQQYFMDKYNYYKDLRDALKGEG
jgi:hypothetical protein